MPVPLIIGGITLAAGAYGAYKGVKGVIDHKKAKEINEDARIIVNEATERLEEQKEKTSLILNDYGSRKLRAFNGVVAEFIDTFGQLKNVDTIRTPELEKLELGDFSAVTFSDLRSDYELLKSSGLGLGAGAFGGAAMAFGAYNGTMLLATASTGTAISTLSGAAASNATLAWLGGGSLATGGGGIALGTMVLGGLVAGPALAIFGHIVGSSGEEALNSARSNLEQARTVRDEADLMTDKLKAVSDVVSLANSVFSMVSSRLRRSVHELRNVIDTHGADYQDFPREAKESVYKTVKLAQLIKAMIDTPILDQDGNLVLSTKARVEGVKALLSSS